MLGQVGLLLSGFLLMSAVTEPVTGIWQPAAGSRLLVADSQPSFRRAVQLPPRISTQVDTASISVGGQLNLTATVEHDAGSVIAWPDSVDLEPFEVLSVRYLEPVRDGDRVVSAARLTLTAFELGDLELPGFDVAVTSPDSADVIVLTTDAWNVSVASVGLDESGDIRDIKGPLEIARNWLLLLPWLALVALIGAVGYWLYKRSKTRKRPDHLSATELPTAPPHEVAYRALAELEASGLLERGDVKSYFTQASEIIRRYVEGRYRVDALEMASHEVLLGLDEVGVPFDTRLEFEQFLGNCDLVKFAKWVPEMEACWEIVPWARRIVDETKLEEQAVAGPQSDSAAGVSREGTAASATLPGGEEGGQ
jgi:hypothetical protein